MEIWLARGIPIFQRRKLGLGNENHLLGVSWLRGRERDQTQVGLTRDQATSSDSTEGPPEVSEPRCDPIRNWFRKGPQGVFKKAKAGTIHARW